MDPKSLANLRPPFQPGQTANPGGKTAARKRLERKYLEDLHDAWQEKGREVIDRLIAEKPEHVLRAVGALLPKEIKHTEDHASAERTRRLLELVDRRLEELAATPGERAHESIEPRAAH